MRLLFESSAPVRAPLPLVQKLIDDEWVLDQWLGKTGRAYVEVDHRGGAVGIQGHWWYRGEISAASSGDRTTVTYRVFDIAARGTAWAVPLANRLFIGYRRSVEQTTAQLARATEARLTDG